MGNSYWLFIYEVLGDLGLQNRGEEEILALRQDVHGKICKTAIEGVFLFIHLDEIHLALYRHLNWIVLLHNIQDRNSELVGNEQWHYATLCNNNTSYRIVAKLINYKFNNVYDSNSVLLEFLVFQFN